MARNSKVHICGRNSADEPARSTNFSRKRGRRGLPIASVELPRNGLLPQKTSSPYVAKT